jgi:hypothetical protein
VVLDGPFLTDVLAVRKWIPADLPHKSHRRASIERQHGIQQNLCAGRCIGLSNRFSLVNVTPVVDDRIKF